MAVGSALVGILAGMGGATVLTLIAGSQLESALAGRLVAAERIGVAAKFRARNQRVDGS